MHWLNALAVVVLMMNGWRVYNATRVAIPADITRWAGSAILTLCRHGCLASNGSL
jgi:Ni,Fe-hydrogenase I cytochrome b subunit